MKDPGQFVLEKVAKNFRDNPASWSKGWGYLPDGTYVQRDPDASTVQNMKSFCIDVAIMRFGALYGGPPVIAQARRMVYNCLQAKHKRNRIWRFNDASNRKVDQVIALVEQSATMADGRRSASETTETADVAETAETVVAKLVAIGQSVMKGMVPKVTAMAMIG